MTTIDRSIATAAEVQALASEREGETLDYKGREDPAHWWELAKDIAAFANHVGGVVLLGAFERNDGTADLRGLPPDEVTALIEAYETAARDKCRPSPLVACKRIPWMDGREMLAVNVRAYPGLVGAVHYAARKDTKDPNGPLIMLPTSAWQFPMRVGNDNRPLPLEQAIMQMSTHARRVFIHLAAISDRSRVKLSWRRPDDRDLRVPTDCTLKAFSIERNVATFTPKETMAVLNVPLDDVETVWNEEDGAWVVRVSGFVETVHYQSPTRIRIEYFSRPRGAS